jgi:hypothetical protein
MSYPMGMLMARVIPKHMKFFNPGPFSIKEHVITYIIASSAGGKPYGVDNVIVQYSAQFINDRSVNYFNAIW